MNDAVEVRARYMARPLAFVREVIGVTLDPWQRRVLRNVGRADIAVRSANGVGKTALAAWITIWAVVVCEMTVACTAPTAHQLHDVLWREIRKWLRFARLAHLVDITATTITLKKRPGAVAVARTSAKPEGLSGFHADELLFVVDEASGVADDTMAVVEGALTTEGAHCLLIGNPTRPTGYFADCFAKNRSRFATETVSAEDTERVDPDWTTALGATWGRDSDVYRIRVLGLPPRGEAKGYFAPHLVDEAMARHDSTEPDGGLEIGVDPARYGDDRTAICARRGWKVIFLHSRYGLSVAEVTAWVAQVIGDLAQVGEQPVVRIDDGGVGGGVSDLLAVMVTEGSLLADVQPMNFGGAGDRSYATNTGVWAHTLRRLMQEGLLALPQDAELRTQLVTRTFATNLKGKIVLEPKDHLRDRGLSSPDLADALMLAFAGTQVGGGWETAWYLARCSNPRCNELYLETYATCPHCGAPNEQLPPPAQTTPAGPMTAPRGTNDCISFDQARGVYVEDLTTPRPLPGAPWPPPPDHR